MKLKEGVILAAGRGKRLSEYLGDMQKCMLEFRGKPLLHHTFENFESAGFEKVFIMTGYGAKDVEQYFSGLDSDTQIEFVHDNNLFVDSTSHTMFLLKDKIESDEFIYSHGEIFYSGDLIARLSNNALDGRSAILSLSDDLSVAPSHPRANILEGKINDMCLYPLKDDCTGEFSYMGVSRLSIEIFDYLSDAPRMSDALSAMVEEGKNLGFIEYSGEWAHFGTKEDLDLFGVDV